MLCSVADLILLLNAEASAPALSLAACTREDCMQWDQDWFILEKGTAHSCQCLSTPSLMSSDTEKF